MICAVRLYHAFSLRETFGSFGPSIFFLLLASTLVAGQSVTVSPTSLSFGNQAVSTTSTAKTVTLKNGTTSVLTISSISASGDYSQSNTCGTSLVAGASCTISITITPTTSGSRTGTLTVTDGASNSPQTVALSGTGVLQATLTPASLSFGSQAVATSSAAKAVTLKNNVPTTLSISSVAISGDYAQTNTCGASLAAGASCTVSVTFTPTTTGSRTGTLTVTDSANNSPQTVSLSGTGVLQATVTPATLSFGNQAVGTSSVAKTVTLKNSLATTLSISSVGVSGDYAQTNTCGTSLGAGASCTISVTFTPTTTGSRTGTLTVTDNANNSPQTVSLTGNGIVPVTVSPASLAFGNQAVSRTSAAKTVTVSNKQPTAVTISSITTPTDYAQTNTCGSQLAAQGTCTVSVTFTPSTTGSRPGTLTITDNASNSPQTVTLTGTGTTLPTITALSVTSGFVGTSVSITGTGFGGSQGSSTVTFNGVAATPTSWKSTSIVVAVPAAATTGTVVVTVNGGSSNGIAFTVVPSVTGLSATSGIAGISVTITGSGFGLSAQGAIVTFNGVSAVSTNWTPTSISTTVPAGATGGAGTVVLTVGGVSSNAAAFTVTPNITSLSPNSGPIGTPITIAGTGFGSQQGTSSVAFNSTAAVPTSWSPSSIVVPVPSGAQSGNVIVTVNGVASAGANFTVTTSGLITARFQHSATLLPTGKILVAAGVNCSPTGTCSYLTSAELVDPVSGVSVNTGSLGTARVAPSVLLANGKVLIAGGSTCDATGNCGSLSSAEIYDPATGSFTRTGSLQVPRNSHSMTLLPDGKVLIAGGETCSASFGGGSENRPPDEPVIGGARLVNANFTPTVGAISCTAQETAELYDPSSGTFSYTTGALNVARYNHAAVRLIDGRVLIVGGSDETKPLWSSEIYSESADSFVEVPNGLGTARTDPTAVLLNNGLVLITGGSTCEAPICPTSSAELFNPSSENFQSTTGSMSVPRLWHTAKLLTNGKVLLAGGYSSCVQANSCVSESSNELYDPGADTFTSTQPMTTARAGATATLVSSGSVLVTGGINNGLTSTGIELYQPSTLTPAGLQSIAVTPATISIAPGAVQQFTATGSFSDGTTSILESAVWNSSNASIAPVSNMTGNQGSVFALALGSATITASAGSVSGTASLTVQVPSQSGGFVTTRGQMQSSLYGQTATELSTGQLLIAGGMSNSGVVNQAQLYNPASQTFVATNAMNASRWLHTATLLNDGTVLIAGGSDLANQETLDTAEIYNPATGSFTLLTSTLNTARVGHTATLLNNGQVLLVGGYDPATGLIADAELYDPPTQTFIDLGDTILPRYRHTAIAQQNGQVLIAGGETDATPTAAYGIAELFDPANQTFTQVPSPMIATREGHAAVLLNNGQILLSGGDIPGRGSLDGAEIYDPASNTFRAITALMSVKRAFHTMNILNGGKVLITGGVSDSNGSSTVLRTTELYNPTGQTFTTVGNLASGRKAHTASLMNDGTILVAGGTEGTNIFSTAELYTASQLTGLTNIAIAPAAPSIGAGAQQRFTAVGTFTNGGTQTLSSVLWSSTSASVAGVSSDATNPGVAASAGQGTTTIMATAGGINGSAALTVTAPTLASIQLSPTDTTIALGATQQFTATGVYTDGSTQDLTGNANWTSSSAGVVINGNGLAAGVFQGTASVGATYGGLSALTTLSVAGPGLVSISVSPSTGTIALGGSQQYQAIGTYSDGSTQNITTLVAWSSGSNSVVTVNNTGIVRGVAQGSTTVAATFESITGTASVAVGPPSVVSLSLSPGAASLTVGATQQLSATGTYTDGSVQNLTASSTWVSSNASVVSVNSSGLATAVAAGNATITASSGPASGMATLIVTTTSSAANLNTSRYLHSATTLDGGHVLVAGGATCPTPGSCTYLNSAELYDPAANVFTNTRSMATARSAPSVQLNSGKVLIAGGYTCDGSGNCSSLNTAEIYDPTSGTFSSAGTMTVARSGHTMTVLGNGTVLIAGGETCTSANTCTALSSAEIYDPGAGSFTATLSSMSAARFGASAIRLNSGSVLIAGGFDGTNLATPVETYSAVTNSFTGSGPALGVPRYNTTATLLNSGKVLIAGGSTCAAPGCPTNAAEIYDPSTNSLTTVTGGMNVSRFNHTATLATNGNVVIAGGYSSCASSCTADASAEYFDPVAGTFTSSQAIPTAIAGQTANLLANGSVLLIGGISAGTTVAGDSAYEPSTSTPAGLVSVSVAPTTSSLIPGQSEQVVATGTFTDGSTQTLQSVIWTSSNPSIVGISNAAGNAGIANAQANGVATITATAGDVGGSATVNVAAVVSLAIAPANPAFAAGMTQQFTLTATFSDGSTQNVASSANWTTSSNAVFTVAAGYGTSIASGNATITASFGGVQTTTSVTVRTPIAPIVSGVSPSSGAPGSQVTINGSSFGSPQAGGIVWLVTAPATVVSWSDTQIVATVASTSRSGSAQVEQVGLLSNTVPFNVSAPTILSITPSTTLPGGQVTITGQDFGQSQGSKGSVWLGTTPGTVVTWSDTQIVATVSSIARSGTAQVMQNGSSSNTVPITIATATITSVIPPVGTPGEQVTILGSSFGMQMGNGQVFLGTAAAQVQNWSDTEIVAIVGATAKSGNALVLQNGITSNAVPFAVDALHIASVTPNSGGPGTSVTIAGTGFGWNQLGGSVILGGQYGQVISWSDDKIVAVVASNAVTGIVKVLQSGASSNAVTFTVPGSSNPVTLVPNMLNLVVGQTQVTQALNSSGQPVTGLSWTSSNPNVVSLSTDDPPVLTALLPGGATIIAGGAAIDVTVYPGALPLGTTVWSNPGDGSGVQSIVPAVPSATGIADVFATNSDCNVQAIASDGTTGWTTNVAQPPNFSGNPNLCNPFVPDFQGGMVVKSEITTYDGLGDPIFKYQLQRFDGMTGQAYPASTPVSKWWQTLNPPAAGWGPGQYGFFVPPFVVHTDGTIFSLSSDSSFDPSLFNLGGAVLLIDPLTGKGKGAVEAGPPPTQNNGQVVICQNVPEIVYCVPSYYSSFHGFGNLIVAGDGYAYVPYAYQTRIWPEVCIPDSNGPGCSPAPPCTTSNAGGISTTYDSAFTGTEYLNLLRIDTSGNASSITLGSWSISGDCYGGTYAAPSNAYVITNADQGALVTWQLETGAEGSTGQKSYYVATTSGTGLVSTNTLPKQITPVLQTQDSTFFGTDANGNMIRFDQSGNIRWSVADSPQVATADNGVVGVSGTTYDADGNATGQVFVPTQSWAGYAYQIGSTEEVRLPRTPEATIFWQFAGANNSHNGSAKKLPPPDATHNHTLTIRDVSGQGINVFKHITVQVDNDQEVGFGPVHDLTAKEVLLNTPVSGHIEPRAAGVTTLDAVTIYLTKDEADHARATISSRSSNGGDYQLRGRSCVDFAEDVVRITGFTAPTDTLPASLPKDIRAEQIKHNTTQAP